MRGLICRRKIPIVIQFILLLLFVCLTITLLSKSSFRIQNVQQTITKTVLKNDAMSLSSACLSRDVLNSPGVQLYSNRLLNKQYYLTIGIPTIARSIGNEYLMKTLRSLTTNQSLNGNKSDILIVVQLGDMQEEKRTQLASEIKEKYSHLINDGILDIIQVYPFNYYPSFDKLKRRFGDSEMRVKWRSKQVIDFSFLSCYCHGLGKYHLQLEDDVIASPYYYLKLKDFIEGYEAKEHWFTLDASVLGYIGKVYHNYDLNEIATFYYIFFDEMPVDWMEYTWREIKGQVNRWRFRPASLFQHIGFFSSLKDKKQGAREPYFDKYSQKFLGLNPPAMLYTNLIEEHKTKLQSAYGQGGGYFWGTCHHKPMCFIKVIFNNNVQVRQVAVETGGNFAINDTIHRGSLKIGKLNPITNHCDDYQVVSSARFTQGTFDIKFAVTQEVKCLRIEIERQNEWIFIREINVWSGEGN